MHQVDFTLMGIIQQMGILAKLIGLILVIMSVWSLNVSIDRLIAFAVSRRQSAAAIEEAYDRFYEDRIDEAVEATRKYPRGHLARIIGAALASYLHDWDRGAKPDTEAAERAVEKERGLIVADMKRGLTSLATISATAPFVGLLGTVIGIINAFTGMASTGSGGLGAVSGGIAEALVTTAFGLFVAIPAVWVFNYFNGQVEMVQTDIDTIKAEVIDYLIRRGEKHAARAKGEPRSQG